MQRTSQAEVAAARQILDRYRSPLALAGVAIGVGAEALVHPALIVPIVVVTAGTAVGPIGLLATVTQAAWALPQLFSDPRGLSAGRFNWPAMVTGARAVVALLIALALLGANSGLPGVGLVFFALFWGLGGLVASGRPTSIMADTGDDFPVSTERHHFWGGVVAILAGLMAVRLLGPDGPSWPVWAVLLALIVSAALGVSAVMLWQGVTPAASSPIGQLWRHLSLAPSLLAHGRRLRRYTVFRILLMAAALADPFYLVYSIRGLDLPLQSAGLYLALFALVRTGAGLVFPRLVLAGQARTLAQLCAFARLLIPLLVLALPLILEAAPIERATVAWSGPVAFAGLVVLYAWAVSSTEATDVAYLRDALAPAHRPAMHAFWLALLAMTSLVFVGASAIIQQWGFQVLFFVAFGASLITVFASGLLLSVPPADTRDLTTSGALPTFRDSADW